MKNINIQSQIDLITNSSTEVFTMVSAGGISNLKKIIDQVLKLGGSDKTSDDLFEIIEIPSDKDLIIEYLEDEEDINFEEMSLEEVETMIFEVMRYSSKRFNSWCNRSDITYKSSYKVLYKDTDVEDPIMNLVNELFDADYVYD